jgi:hypothetical protein
MITKTCSPDQFAIWTSQDLRETVDEYVKLRNDLPRSGKPSPNDLAAACREKYGPPPRNMPTVDDLQTLLLPFVEGETRTASKRGIIKANNKRYGIRGEQNILRRYAGNELKVRWVPEDPNTVFVFLESPRIAVRCVNLACKGPSSDIIDRGNEIQEERQAAAVAAGTPIPTPTARKAAHTAAVVQKESELKIRKARKRRLANVATSASSQADSDANIPTLTIG